MWDSKTKRVVVTDTELVSPAITFATDVQEGKQVAATVQAYQNGPNITVLFENRSQQQWTVDIDAVPELIAALEKLLCYVPGY